MSKQLIILSGPSCVGKGPLVGALARFHPEIEYDEVPVIKSKESRPGGPRPNEVECWDDPDYFRSQEEIYRLRSNNQYLVGDVRGLPQALDLKRAEESNSPRLLVEAHHTIGAQIRERGLQSKIRILTIFVSPLGKQELADLRRAEIDAREYVVSIMLHKLIVRARFQGKLIDAATTADLMSRAKEAPEELRSACRYMNLIINYDAEGSPNWHQLSDGAFTGAPEGSAGRALTSLANILRTGNDAEAEHWESSPL